MFRRISARHGTWPKIVLLDNSLRSAVSLFGFTTCPPTGVCCRRPNALNAVASLDHWKATRSVSSRLCRPGVLPAVELAMSKLLDTAKMPDSAFLINFRSHYAYTAQNKALSEARN